MPRKIRQLISDLEQAGYRLESTRGSHRKFRHPRVAGALILSGNSSDDAIITKSATCEPLFESFQSHESL